MPRTAPVGRMLTMGTLLLLPFVFSMSVYRAYQLPRAFMAGAQNVNPAHPVTASLALAATYLALVI